MDNKKTLEYWSAVADNCQNELAAKVGVASNDHTQLDADFIMRYADENSEILDLASSTGMTINKYYQKVKHIEAVELYPEFTKFIAKTPKITIINKSIADYTTDKKFDLVNMFGIVQYFNEKEITELYKKYATYLKEDGKLLIKNQFGVKEDVLVEGYSEEQKSNYYSEYRFIDKEVAILKSVGYKNIEVIDIYPSECNRWENTHFYAIVSER